VPASPGLMTYRSQPLIEYFQAHDVSSTAGAMSGSVRRSIPHSLPCPLSVRRTGTTPQYLHARLLAIRPALCHVIPNTPSSRWDLLFAPRRLIVPAYSLRSTSRSLRDDERGPVSLSTAAYSLLPMPRQARDDVTDSRACGRHITYERPCDNGKNCPSLLSPRLPCLSRGHLYLLCAGRRRELEHTVRDGSVDLAAC
jgi:hypothetical protein